MSSLRQATKDIKSLSDALARTTFERHRVADERRLLLQRGDGLNAVQSLRLEDCRKDLRRCTDLFEKALIQAASDSSSFGHWWAAWVTSPVSTRLLQAMQTLMDGCIFQVWIRTQICMNWTIGGRELRPPHRMEIAVPTSICMMYVHSKGYSLVITRPRCGLCLAFLCCALCSNPPYSGHPSPTNLHPLLYLQLRPGAHPQVADQLVEELAQVMVVQPQLLNMVKAGAAWARQHAHLSHLDTIYPASVSACLHDITSFGMASLHSLCPTILCLGFSSAMDPASPKLGQSAHDWFMFALETLKAGGWQGNWPQDETESLLNYGIGIPMAIMIKCVERQSTAVLPLPWNDRPRYLNCALQAAEWRLSAANANSFEAEDLSWFWGNCHNLAASLASGESTYCSSSSVISLYIDSLSRTIVSVHHRRGDLHWAATAELEDAADAGGLGAANGGGTPTRRVRRMGDGLPSSGRSLAGKDVPVPPVRGSADQRRSRAGSVRSGAQDAALSCRYHAQGHQRINARGLQLLPLFCAELAQHYFEDGFRHGAPSAPPGRPLHGLHPGAARDGEPFLPRRLTRGAAC